MGRYKCPQTPSPGRGNHQLLSPPSASTQSGSQQRSSAPFGTPDLYSTPIKSENRFSIFTPPHSTKFPSFDSPPIRRLGTVWSEDDDDKMPGTPCQPSRFKREESTYSDLHTQQLPVSPEIDDDNVSSEEDVQDGVDGDMEYDDYDDEEDLKDNIVMKDEETESIDKKDFLRIKEEDNISTTEIFNKQNCNLMDAYTHSCTQFKAENAADFGESVKNEEFTDDENEIYDEQFSPQVASLKRKRANYLQINVRLLALQADDEGLCSFAKIRQPIKREKKEKSFSSNERFKAEEEAKYNASESGSSKVVQFKSRQIKRMRKGRRSENPMETTRYPPVKTEIKDHDEEDPFKETFERRSRALGLGISYSSSAKEAFDISRDRSSRLLDLENRVQKEPYSLHIPETLPSKVKQTATHSSVKRCKLEKLEKDVEKWAVKAVEDDHRSKLPRSQLPLPCSTIKDEPYSLYNSPPREPKHVSKYRQHLYTRRNKRRVIKERSPTPSVIINQYGGNEVIFRGKKTLYEAQAPLPVPTNRTSFGGWSPVSSRKGSFVPDISPRERPIKKNLRDSSTDEANPINLKQGDKLTTVNLKPNRKIVPLLFSHYMGTTTPKSYNTFKYLPGPYNPRLLALNAACDAFEAKMRVPPTTPTSDAASEASSETLCLGDGEGGSSWEGCKDSDDGDKWGFDAVWGDSETLDGEGTYMDAVDDGEEFLRVESPCPSCDD
jgi:hypothetical protein